MQQSASGSDTRSIECRNFISIPSIHRYNSTVRRGTEPAITTGGRLYADERKVVIPMIQKLQDSRAVLLSAVAIFAVRA